MTVGHFRYTGRNNTVSGKAVRVARGAYISSDMLSASLQACSMSFFSNEPCAASTLKVNVPFQWKSNAAEIDSHSHLHNSIGQRERLDCTLVHFNGI